MKWKIATASAVTAAMLSAPVAAAAPSGSGANNAANNAVGQVIGQVTGANPTVIIETLNGLQGLLGKLGFGKNRGGNGNGAQLQQATIDNVGKTLNKPEIYGTRP
ncbi:MAG: hypothetical protein H6523_19535 [Mycolicibacterium sp.]|nr:hypothetical protein [Mycolicibacterium sp.]